MKNTYKRFFAAIVFVNALSENNESNSKNESCSTSSTTEPTTDAATGKEEQVAA